MSGSESNQIGGGNVNRFRQLTKDIATDENAGATSEEETLVVTCESPPGDERPYAKVKVLGDELIGLMDSGASITLLGKGGYKLAKKWKVELVPSMTKISTADGTLQNVQHYVEIPFEFDNQLKWIKTLLVEGIKRKLILGYDFWKSFGITCAKMDEVEEIYPLCNAVVVDPDPPKLSNTFKEHELTDVDKERLEKIIRKFSFVKDDGPLSYTTLTEHVIDTKHAKPIKQKQYVFSPYIQEKIRLEVDRLLARDIIEKVPAPTWLNPVRPVPKPDDKIRLCLDARKLNEVTVKNSYPQQNVNRILGRLEGTKYLTALDLTDAFYQILLNPESRGKTAFAIPGVGSFMYKRMPMGLVNSGATLSELVDRLFGAEFEPECFPYLDDFIIATKTLDKHFEILERVAEKLTTAGLVISAKKSKFCMKSLKYLGHVIDEKGIRADPDKIAPIREYPAPTCVKEVRRFIGLTGWYRRFIKNFADISAPITDLIKKKNKGFVWSEEAQSSFDKMKKALSSAPILATPNYSEPFNIQTDASDGGIGGVLTQNINEEEKVIAYMSQKLSRAQQKYHVTERECLAVLTAIEKFRPYIEGVHFTVITDHASLLWLQNLKDPTGRLARWALRMQAFDFELKHRKGKLNVVPDAMSRAFRVEMLQIPRNFETTDEWYNDIRKSADKRGNSKANYRMDDCNLYYCGARGLDDSKKGWKICVPRERRGEIMSKYHDAITAAHGGISKTVARIKELYYWPTLAKDVEEHIRNCSVCKVTKPTNMNQTALMGEYRDPREPFRMMALDYMGPLPLTKRGNRFMLVIVDVFSKYVFIKPLKQQSAKATVDFMKNEIFLRFGVPEVIISDNGPQLRSEIFIRFLEENQIKHWLTPIYHPQANPTEAANKTIITAIRAYTNDELPHDKWDESIPEISYALNAARHSATKTSPNWVIFGRRITESGKQYIDINENTTSIEKFKMIRDKVSAYLKMAYEREKHKYNLRAKEIDYSPGEIVYRKNLKLSQGGAKYSNKLANKFIKAMVIKKVGTNTYEIKDIDSKRSAIYHTRLLKR